MTEQNLTGTIRKKKHGTFSRHSVNVNTLMGPTSKKEKRKSYNYDNLKPIPLEDVQKWLSIKPDEVKFEKENEPESHKQKKKKIKRDKSQSRSNSKQNVKDIEKKSDKNLISRLLNTKSQIHVEEIEEKENTPGSFRKTSNSDLILDNNQISQMELEIDRIIKEYPTVTSSAALSPINNNNKEYIDLISLELEKIIQKECVKSSTTDLDKIVNKNFSFRSSTSNLDDKVADLANEDMEISNTLSKMESSPSLGSIDVVTKKDSNPLLAVAKTKGRSAVIPAASFLARNGHYLKDFRIEELAPIIQGPNNTKIIGELVFREPNNPDTLEIKWMASQGGTYKIQVYHRASKVIILPEHIEVSLDFPHIVPQKFEENESEIDPSGAKINLNALRDPFGNKIHNITASDIKVDIISAPEPLDCPSTVTLLPDGRIDIDLTPKLPGRYEFQFYYKEEPILSNKLVLILPELKASQLKKKFASQFSLIGVQVVYLINEMRNNQKRPSLCLPLDKFQEKFKETLEPILILRCRSLDDWKGFLSQSDEEVSDLFLTIFDHIVKNIEVVTKNLAIVRDPRIRSKVLGIFLYLTPTIDSLKNTTVKSIHSLPNERVKFAEEFINLLSELATMKDAYELIQSDFSLKIEPITGLDLTNVFDPEELLQTLFKHLSSCTNIPLSIFSPDPVPNNIAQTVDILTEVVRKLIASLKQSELDINSLLSDSVKVVLMYRYIRNVYIIKEFQSSFDNGFKSFMHALILILHKKLTGTFDVRQDILTFLEPLKDLRIVLQQLETQLELGSKK